MRREPMVVSLRWLDRERRRGTVIRRRCWECEKWVWIPPHLWGVQRRCEECETERDAERTKEAAAEWRRYNMLSPLIEEELDAGDD